MLSKGKTGYTFLRQRPIGKYIADFLCKELQLVIKVDEYSHNFKTAEDVERDRELQALGYTTIRFSDEEVMKDLGNVKRVIESFIERQQL